MREWPPDHNDGDTQQAGSPTVSEKWLEAGYICECGNYGMLMGYNQVFASLVSR
jgi:hypothetical protein